MKLEKFKRKNNKKKIIIIGSVILFLLITVVIMHRSFAFFENIQEFNVIKGSVPDQNYDIMLSLTTEDENQNKQASNQIPEKNSEQKYEVEVSCNNNAVGSWNYDDWKPEINEFRSSRTKCTINFKENNDFVYPVTEKIEDGKKIIANAITQKGINTSAEATFETMANNIKNIKTTSNLHIGAWGISVFGSSYNIGAQASKSYTLTNGHYYVLVLRLQSNHSGCGWISGDYAAANISLSGATLMQKFTLGQGNVNYAGLIFLVFKATSNNVRVNGIRFTNNCDRWNLSDAIIEIYNS